MAYKVIQNYLQWKKINEIFPLNVTGIVTARDKFVIGIVKREILNKPVSKYLASGDNDRIEKIKYIKK